MGFGTPIVGLMVLVGCGPPAAQTCDVECGISQDAFQMCDAFAQTGCLANEKCSWIQDQVPIPQPTGHIQCVPDGSGAEGTECAFGPPGADGYDNCIAGTVCVNATCHFICSAYDIPCGDGEQCEKYDVLAYDPYPLGICF